MPVGAVDLETTRGLVVPFLRGLTGEDWSAPVPDLEWTCERTLQHMINTAIYYAMHAATQAKSPLPYPRGPAAASGLNPTELVTELDAAAAVLAAVIRATPRDARLVIGGTATDPEGIAAIACDELLIHTWDIGRGFGRVFAAPDAPLEAVIDRLFPWAPKGNPAWERFLWCNGRAALSDRPRLGPDWPRWLAPVKEWSGSDPTVAAGS